MTEDPNAPKPSADPGSALRPTGAPGSASSASFDVTEATAAGVPILPDDLPGTPSSSRLPKKRQIGPYMLVRLLGRGGMGAVYEAVDTRLNRHVALKVMRAEEDADPKEIERFRREAQNAGKLRHPNIVPVHDVGVEGGQDYLVMDLVDGVTLGEALRQRQLTYKEKVTLLEKVARAVQYAHEQGVIHRDLKPSNVIIEQRAGGSSSTVKPPSSSLGSVIPKVQELGEPLVMDFGLAKDITQDSSLSGSGQMLGTPAYMPPEQALAKTQDVGPRSDVYGLGAILYEMLTGRPPFTAESIMPLLKAVVMDDPVPPRRIVPKAPRDLESICLKCLEKEPARRYASAAALADDLRNWREGEPITARPYTWTYRAAKKIAKHRVPVALAALAFVLLVGFGGWYGWEWWKTYGKWTLVYEQDFSKNPDLSAWEYWDMKIDRTVAAFTLENGALRPRPSEWCWLKDVPVPGAVRLEVRLRFRENPDGLDLCINSRLKKTGGGCPAGYSCQVGGYRGTVDFVSRNDQARWPDNSSGAPSLVRAGNLHTVVFQREGGLLSLAVDGVEVSRQADLLPIAGAELDGVGLRTWAAGLEVHSVKVYRRALAQKASPVVAGDALVKAGRFADAEREYREIAADYPGAGLGDLALTKAFLVAIARGAEGREGAAAVRAELDRLYPNSPYRAQVLEMSALELWKERRFREALDALPGIQALDADSRVALRMLDARREPLPDDVGQNLLRGLALLRRTQNLNVSDLGLTSLEPLRGMPLTGVHCDGNQLTSLEPLRGMSLTSLGCDGNQLTSLEPLAGMPLKYLTCINNQLTDLEPLQGMPLTVLRCKSNKITTLEPLRGMRLSSLWCADNQLTNLEPLRGTPLTFLACDWNQLTNLEPLRGMPLTDLDCSFNPLTTLEPLRGMSLTRLRCGSNHLADLEPLRRMPLTGLSCGDNELTNLEPLRGMPLKSLDCHHNRLTNLEPLGGMSLTDLACGNNELTSLEPFVRTPPAGPFFFDCETLPEDELQRAMVAWRQDPSHQQHARNAELALVLRRNDVAALRRLARPFSGHAYLFIPRWLTWAEAKSFCEKCGGHLATVTSKEENEFVGSLSGAPGYGVWIGLEVAEGKAAWVTGEPLGFQAYPVPFYSRTRGKTICMESDCRWLNVASPVGSCFVIEWDK